MPHIQIDVTCCSAGAGVYRDASNASEVRLSPFGPDITGKVATHLQNSDYVNILVNKKEHSSPSQII